MLIRNDQLTTEQLIELDSLRADCKHIDGNTIALYGHLLGQKRPMPCNLLYYQQTQLIGFLSVFFFYEEACEMAVLVAPTHRGKQIATQMIHEILPLIRAQSIKTLIISTPSGLSNDWLLARGFHYRNSEYQMQRRSPDPVPPVDASLTIRLAISTDLQALCAIDSACFPTQQADMFARFLTLLNDPNYRLFIALKEGMPIGKAHLHKQQDTARLADIAIIPDLQGRGFGSALLAYCINYSLAENLPNLSLDVETTNQKALNLYTRLGFNIKNAYDFWDIPVAVLIQPNKPSA